MMSNIPDGWTDDMRIDIPPPRTVEELVEFVLLAEAERTPPEATMAALVLEFGLSEEDADLAWDRTLGGKVRAGTTNPANEPDRTKDPVAWTSYHRCRRSPVPTRAVTRGTSHAAEAPPTASSANRPWWAFWR
jgi:hypothetical protein